MIIRIALIAGLLLCLAYAFLQRRKSALVSIAISFTSVAGIYFVVFPEQTTELAQMLGVGRGTDLILYCWIVITLVISMNLRFNLLGLQEQLTELVRELALRAPRRNESNGAQQAVARSTAISLDSNVEAPAADQRSGSSATKALSVPAASDRGGVWPVMTGLIVFALVVVRTMPLAGPFIWDEGIYVQQAHFGSDFGKVYPNALFADHPMPNHLFLAIYGSTFHLDTQYMQAARILNALFLAFAGVFIFAVARRVLRVHAAFLLAVLSAAGAITIYAAMFMPEPLYFLGFWIAVWACTRTIERSLIRSAIDVGAVLGVMMLVKPHAAMLLVGFSAYFLVFPLIVKPDLKWTQGVASVVACALSFLVVWAIGTMVITGHVQLPSVLSYAPLGGVVLKSAGLWGQLRDIVFNLSGHAAALSLLLGAAIYGLFFRVAADIARPRSPFDIPKALAFLAVILTCTMVAFIAKYTAGMTVYGPSEGLGRLHGRYYDFLLPLVALAFFAGWDKARPQSSNARVLFVVVGIALVIAAAAWFADRFDLSANDFPEASMLGSRAVLLFVAAGALASIAASMLKGKIYRDAVALLLLGVLGASTAITWHQQAVIPPFDGNFAADALRRSEPGADGSHWQVFLNHVDARMPWMSMALRSPSRIDVWSENRALDCTKIAADVTRVLLLDPIPFDCGFERVESPGVSLWKRGASSQPALANPPSLDGPGYPSSALPAKWTPGNPLQASVPVRQAASCALDIVNAVETKGAETIRVVGNLDAYGWVADAAGTLPQRAWMLLESDGSAFHAPVQLGHPRPDVAAATRIPALAAAGYRALAPVDGVPPGRYRASMIGTNGEGSWRCDLKRTVEIEAR